MVVWQLIVNYYRYRNKLVITCVDKWLNSVNFKILNICNDKDIEIFTISYSSKMQHAITNYSTINFIQIDMYKYSWLPLSRTRLTRISGWDKFLSKYIVESNSDESKFRLSRIKVLVPRCRTPYYLHSLSRIYLSKHVYYLGFKIGSQVKHPVIEFDIFTLGYFTCLFHNLSN